MTTPRDLLITAMEVAPSRPVERGEMSLALAGAELIDFLAAGVITLDDDRIVPGDGAVVADRLLDQAVASLVREAPYEAVSDWLWRRGRELAPAYLAALETDGVLTRQRSHWKPFQGGQRVLADSPDRRLARDRWESNDPVLAALATAVGIRGQETEDTPDTTASPGAPDEAVETVLAAVNDALIELEAVRQRRAIEQAAFDNIWRGQ
ncbi:GOLPH3/VPS74 family protein [Streptomyces hesseae]|uniref:GPP34 family phosphoprotein n=1 Tax=Streptomyces hesseae TaxID=3075519 RepID=A0ABU2SMP2_9ACTN|nr:GPP34 family phosphoprotein [Streptomyces sp. DSM 40473]MDT0449644.1 GPP34 family phosphoprotein [Streptomyces sp. DSM 40473]